MAGPFSNRESTHAAAVPHDLVAQVLEASREGRTFRSIVDEVLRTLALGAGASAATFWVVDQHRRSLLGSGAWAADPGGIHRKFVEEIPGIALPVDGSVVGSCWRSGSPLHVEDVASTYTQYRSELIASCGARETLLLPVRYGSDVLAVLELLDPGAVEVPELERVLVDLGGLLHAHLAAERSHRQEQRLDLALSAGAMGTWDWDRRTGTVAWSPTTEAIYGYEPGAFDGTLETYRERIHPDDRAAMGDALEATLITGGRHHVVHRVLRPDGEVRWVEADGHPIVDEDGTVVGLTGILRDVTERMALLDELSEHVERTEVALAERSRVAELLQRSLLPERLPSIAGLELAAGFRPGAELVGGDFYDAIATDGATYLALGDVSGHGPDAATLTGLARYAVRGLVSANVRNPVAILRHLNDLVLASDAERFLTMVLARVVPEAGGSQRVELCRAGHPLPIVRRADGTVLTLPQQSGTLLGALREVSLGDQVVELEPGDALLLYTDGVTEAQGETERFGDQRLLDVVAGAEPSAAGIVDAVLAAVREHDGDVASDDIALLAVVATGDDAVASTT